MTGLGSIRAMVSGAGGRYQGTMWSFGIVVFPPLLDQDFRFPKAVEDFSREQFIAEPGIEAFAVAVLPR